MVNQTTATPTFAPTLRATQVYVTASICLALGLVMGYLLRRAQGPSPVAPVAHVASPSRPGSATAGAPTPSLQDIKQMADQQAAPLLEKLKADPDNNSLLIQVAAIYHGSHQFKEAAAYYDKAIHTDPRNVALRTKLASSLYRSGDVDGAIAQLNQALSYDPKDANALFNLGMMRLQGKQDGKGAVAAWQRLLKSNPQLSAQRRAEVQKLMADVLTTLGEQRATQGGHSHE